MSSYPECEKMKLVKDDAETIGQFLEWLTENQRDGNYVPLPDDLNDLLSDYFNIDLELVEEEKDQMLEEIRVANKNETKM